MYFFFLCHIARLFSFPRQTRPSSPWKVCYVIWRNQILILNTSQNRFDNKVCWHFTDYRFWKCRAICLVFVNQAFPFGKRVDLWMNAWMKSSECTNSTRNTSFIAVLEIYGCRAKVHFVGFYWEPWSLLPPFWPSLKKGILFVVTVM